MSHRDEGHGKDLQVADLSERITAFGLDAALFVLGYVISFRLCFPDYPYILHAAARQWWVFWTAGFVLFEAFFSSEGRVSPGKLVVGLRIVDLDGEPLGLGDGLIRSVLYPVSAFFGLGFFWALFNEAHQGWHDLPVGSLVVRQGKAHLGRFLVRATAAACLSIAGLSYLWTNVWAGRYHRIMDVADAQVGLSELVGLERQYHLRNGRYASSLFELAPLSGSPHAFLRDMSNVFDLNAGFEIQVSPKSYTISGVAQDDHHTPIRFAGS